MSFLDSEIVNQNGSRTISKTRSKAVAHIQKQTPNSSQTSHLSLISVFIAFDNVQWAFLEFAISRYSMGKVCRRHFACMFRCCQWYIQ